MNALIIALCAVAYLLGIPVSYYIMRRWGKLFWNTTSWGEQKRPIAWAFFWLFALFVEVVLLIVIVVYKVHSAGVKHIVFEPLIKLFGKLFNSIDERVKTAKERNT